MGCFVFLPQQQSSDTGTRKLGVQLGEIHLQARDNGTSRRYSRSCSSTSSSPAGNGQLMPACRQRCMHSCTAAIGDYGFQPALIEEAVQRARLVVMDCNFAVDQLSLLLEFTGRYNRPTATAVVSDSKVVRLLQMNGHHSIDLVALNTNELAELFDHKTGDHIPEVCKRLNAKQVIVTAAAAGYCVVKESGTVKHYRAPHVDNIVSVTGSGDALLAGVLTYWYKNQNLDFDDAITTIATAVRKVLQQPGATVGSLATDTDFAQLAKIAIRNEPLWKRFLSPEIGVAAAVLVAILTVVITILTYELLPSSGPPANTQEHKPGEEATPPR
jgi:hypothetical protein